MNDSNFPSPLTQEMDEVVAGWQRRLLQLDRRNNLLYFRSGRTSVKIEAFSPEEIFHELGSARRGLKFDYIKIKRRTSRVISDDSEPPQVQKEHLSSDCTPEELQRRLGNLLRRAKSWEEEQGLHVLFLALGFLEWRDDDQPAKSPLMLLPVSLTRKSPGEPFCLNTTGDDSVSNDTLRVRIEECLGIQVPELEQDQTPNSYLKAVTQSVEAHPNCQICDEAVLAIFSYSKLAMWRDLQNIRENGTSNAIVRGLSGEIERDRLGNLAEPLSFSSTDLSQRRFFFLAHQLLGRLPSVFRAAVRCPWKSARVWLTCWQHKTLNLGCRILAQ